MALTIQRMLRAGCPSANVDNTSHHHDPGGWHHAASSDQVHWHDRGLGPIEQQENYEGMDSLESPCSGFVTVVSPTVSDAFPERRANR